LNTVYKRPCSCARSKISALIDNNLCEKCLKQKANAQRRPIVSGISNAHAVYGPCSLSRLFSKKPWESLSIGDLCRTFCVLPSKVVYFHEAQTKWENARVFWTRLIDSCWPFLGLSVSRGTGKYWVLLYFLEYFVEMVLCLCYVQCKLPKNGHLIVECRPAINLAQLKNSDLYNRQANISAASFQPHVPGVCPFQICF
jgi:hypothetical protein